MIILLKVEDSPRRNDLVVVAGLSSSVFMNAIKAIRNAEARNDIWRFCAE